MTDLKSVLKKYQNEQLPIQSYEQLCAVYAEKPLQQLSGGQNQMIKILTGLYLSGDNFFFDEPLQYLDSQNVTHFCQMILFLKKQGKSICMIEHSREKIAHLIDREFSMEVQQKQVIIRKVDGN